MDISKKTMEINIQFLLLQNGHKKALAKFTKFWDEIKQLIETINEGKKGEYEDKFMKIKFNSDDNLPLNKMLKLYMLTVIVRSVFDEDGKYYSKVFLDVCMKYKCQNMIGLTFQKELILTKRMHQKGVIFVIIGTSQINILNMSHIFAMVVMT